MTAFGRISILAVFLVAFFVGPAMAQQRIQIGQLLQRIDNLEAEVARLRVAPSQGGADVTRLDQIEVELRRLTGLIERLDFEIRKLTQRTDDSMNEMGARIAALESAGPTATGPSATPQSTESTDSEPYGPTIPSTTPTVEYSSTASLAPESGTEQALAIMPETYEPTAAPTESLVESQPQSPEELYQGGLRLLNRGAFDEAGAQFEELIAAHPGHERSGQAQYWLGDMHFKLGRFEQAATAFLTSFRQWPEGAKAPDSLLKLGMTLGVIGKRDEACLSLSQVPVRYPSASPNLLRRADIESQRAGCGS